MLHAIRYALHIPARTLQAVRRHPLFTVVVLLVVLGLAVVGLWRVPFTSGGRPRLTLNEERYQEARDRLDFCLIVWPCSPEVHLLAARAARLAGDTRRRGAPPEPVPEAPGRGDRGGADSSSCSCGSRPARWTRSPRP